MGYSCTMLSDNSYEGCIKALQFKYGDRGGSGNAWGSDNAYPYAFAEIGREHRDGHISGKIHYCDEAAITSTRSFTIDPDGRVVRFNGLTKKERDQIARDSMVDHIRVHGFPINKPPTDHPAYDLATASFVAI